MSPEQAARRPRPARPAVRRLQPGRHALLPADRQAAVRGRRRRRACSAGRAAGATSPPPRQLDPSIDQALEAVCLKAMATRPEDRYAYARGPGRRRRAVDGRRAGLGLARAGDSRRLAAGAGGTARWWPRRLLLLITAVVGLSVGTVLLSQANARTERQRRLAQANFQTAEANFRKAREAVDEYFTKVSESKLLNVPGLAAVAQGAAGVGPQVLRAIPPRSRLGQDGACRGGRGVVPPRVCRE